MMRQQKNHGMHTTKVHTEIEVVKPSHTLLKERFIIVICDATILNHESDNYIIEY